MLRQNHNLWYREHRISSLNPFVVPRADGDHIPSRGSKPSLISKPTSVDPSHSRHVRPLSYNSTGTSAGRSKMRPVRTNAYHHPHSIHFLPPEVLAHIFYFGSCDPSELGVLFPLRMSHVCGAWRDLALSTHTLWQRITPDLRHRLWKQYIHRSAACLIDVSLTRPPSISSHIGHNKVNAHRVPPFDANNVQWYMGLVAPHIRRWRSLTVKFDQYSPFLWNAALGPCCASGGISSTLAQAWNLEELTLIYPRNDDTKEFMLFGGVAPRLRKVAIAGIHLDWSPGLFSNLVYLDYCHHGFTRAWESVAQVLNVLDVSRKLKELRIAFPSSCAAPMAGGGWDWYPTTFPLRHIGLPYLQRLTVRAKHDIPLEMSTVFGYLHMPSLRVLRLRDGGRARRVFSGLKSFSRSLRRPRTLEVVDMEWGWCEKRFIDTFEQVRTVIANGSYC